MIEITECKDSIIIISWHPGHFTANEGAQHDRIRDLMRRGYRLISNGVTSEGAITLQAIPPVTKD